MSDEWWAKEFKENNRWLGKILPSVFSSNENFIDVEMSNHRIGHPSDILYTDNLMECLGVVLYDKKGGSGALAHIIPKQEPEEIIEEMFCKLNPSQYESVFACITGEIGHTKLQNSRKVRAMLTERGARISYTELGGDDRRALCLHSKNSVCYVINEGTKTFTIVEFDENSQEKFLRVPSYIERELIGGWYANDYG